MNAPANNSGILGSVKSGFSDVTEGITNFFSGNGSQNAQKQKYSFAPTPVSGGRRKTRKSSRKVSRKAKKSRKASRKVHRKASRKVHHKASRKASRKSKKSRKVSRKH